MTTFTEYLRTGPSNGTFNTILIHKEGGFKTVFFYFCKQAIAVYYEKIFGSFRSFCFADRSICILRLWSKQLYKVTDAYSESSGFW